MAWADPQRVRNATLWRSGAVRNAPMGHGWRWQPDLWRTGLTGPIDPASPFVLAPNVELFHDGNAGEVRLNGHRGDPGEPKELALSLRGYSGSFVSLAISLPRVMPSPAHHVVTVEAQIAGPEQTPAYLRINQQIGANAWSTTQSLPVADRPTPVPFDLRDAPDPDGRFWVDVIMEPAEQADYRLRRVSVATHLHPVF